MATLLTPTPTTPPDQTPAARPGRHDRWWLVAALALALLSVGLWLAIGQPAAPAFQGGELRQARVLPTIELQRATGGRFRVSDTRGRLSLVFFGYTTCPDVCPMTLAQVVQARRLLGLQAAQVDAYFITVDPERDTPQRLARYVANFDPSIVGLTGTADELALARAAFGALAQRREVPDSALGYLMDHSATIALVDQESRVRLVYPHDVAPADLAADLRRLLTP